MRRPRVGWRMSPRVWRRFSACDLRRRRRAPHMSNRHLARTAVVGIAITVFAVCCVLPVGYLLLVSLSEINGSAPVLDARQRRLLSNTALLGLGTALLATAIGAPVGLALARISLRRKALLR